MEVHHHAHTSRNKFTHYLWEFLMLFLAVFCGFLAENQREHMVEHRREKQYIQSLFEDLKIDTANLNYTVQVVNESIKKIDTLVLFLKNNRNKDIASAFLARLNKDALPWLQFSLTDRTSLQLKNAGNMRIIGNRKVSDQIILYWSQGEKTKNAQERYETYRLKSRELFNKIIRHYELYLGNNHLSDGPFSVDQITHDQALIDEYGNYIATCGTVLGGYLQSLKKQYEMTVQLFEQLNKDYHLK